MTLRTFAPFIAACLTALTAASTAQADDPPCRTSADCRGGRTCQGQRCKAPQCTRDDECGAGRYCDAAGMCQGGPPTVPAPPAKAAPPPAPAALAPPAKVDDAGTRPQPSAGAPWAEPLLISSLITFSMAYIIPIIGVSAVNATATYPNWANSGFAAIPMVGPWIVVGNANKYIPPVASAMLGIHALLQTGAAVGIIVGVVNRGDKRAAGNRAPRWAVLPTFGPNQAGLMLTVTGF